MKIIDNNKKIVNLFNLLLKTNAVFAIRNVLAEYRAKLGKVEEEELVIDSDLAISGLKSQVRVSFYYLNKYHYFDTDVISSSKKKINLKIPEQIYIRVKRQNKRYDVSDDAIKCHLKLISYNKDVQKNLTGQRQSPVIRKIQSELNNDKPDFSAIVQLIHEENINVCDDFKIYPSLDKLPDQNVAGFLDDFKKPLLLNNLQELKYASTGNNDNDQNFYQIRDYVNYLAKVNTRNVKNIINDLVAYYKNNSIYSLLYVPVIVLRKVAAVLKIINNVSNKKLFHSNDVEYFISIARVINESIVKNKLNSIDQRTQHIALQNISLSGIGISLMDKVFANFLRENSSLKVFLEHNNIPWLSFVGFVKRIAQDKTPVEIGIEINEILPQNHAKLINYINSNFSRRPSL